MSYVLMSA